MQDSSPSHIDLGTARFRTHETLAFARDTPAGHHSVACLVLECFDDIEFKVVNARQECCPHFLNASRDLISTPPDVTVKSSETRWSAAFGLRNCHTSRQNFSAI